MPPKRQTKATAQKKVAAPRAPTRRPKAKNVQAPASAPAPTPVAINPASSSSTTNTPKPQQKPEKASSQMLKTPPKQIINTSTSLSQPQRLVQSEPNPRPLHNQAQTKASKLNSDNPVSLWFPRPHSNTLKAPPSVRFIRPHPLLKRLCPFRLAVPIKVNIINLEGLLASHQAKIARLFKQSTDMMQAISEMQNLTISQYAFRADDYLKSSLRTIVAYIGSFIGYFGVDVDSYDGVSYLQSFPEVTLLAFEIAIDYCFIRDDKNELRLCKVTDGKAGSTMGNTNKETLANRAGHTDKDNTDEISSEQKAVLEMCIKIAACSELTVVLERLLKIVRLDMCVLRKAKGLPNPAEVTPYDLSGIENNIVTFTYVSPKQVGKARQKQASAAMKMGSDVGMYDFTGTVAETDATIPHVLTDDGGNVIDDTDLADADNVWNRRASSDSEDEMEEGDGTCMAFAAESFAAWMNGG